MSLVGRVVAGQTRVERFVDPSDIRMGSEDVGGSFTVLGRADSALSALVDGAPSRVAQHPRNSKIFSGPSSPLPDNKTKPKSRLLPFFANRANM